MKVLLVYTVPPKANWPKGPFRSRWVPTGLSYLGACLKRAGHDVRVHLREQELITNGYDWDAADDRIKSVLREYKPEVVGFSVPTPGLPEAQTIAGWAKEIVGDHVLTIAGGPHPTALPERTLAESPSIDVVVCGEAEHTLVELLDRGPQRDIAGIAYRDNGECVLTEACTNPTDLDSLGPPAYELFDMDYHTTPSRWMVRWLPLSATNIRTSRGCPNRCAFCGGHVVSGLGVRFHSLDYVMDQLLNAVNRFDVEAIRFEDDTIGADRGRLLELCERMRMADLHKRIKWDCCLRVDQAEAELLKSMKSAGCIQVEYGFETGSAAGLKRLGKNATVDLNRKAVELTKAAGLRVFADIMLGLPEETADDFKATVDFIRYARPEVLSPMHLLPLPGTAFFDLLAPEVQQSGGWGDYAYFELDNERFNFTADPYDVSRKRYREFMKYIARPQIMVAHLRDTPRENSAERRKLAGKIAKFCLQHPIRALRVPW